MENGNELNQLLPGQPLRVGVDLIADKNSGALIVIGTSSKLEKISSGGINLADCIYSPEMLSELSKMDGAIIVSTPQELALQDVKRGIRMFDKLGIKIIGLVDNMSFFKGEDGKKYPIFGEGGVKRTAEEFSKEFLCEIPIDPEVGKSGDQGKPIVESNPNNEISKIYLDIAKKIKSSFIEN